MRPSSPHTRHYTHCHNTNMFHTPLSNSSTTACFSYCSVLTSTPPQHCHTPSLHCDTPTALSHTPQHYHTPSSHCYTPLTTLSPTNKYSHIHQVLKLLVIFLFFKHLSHTCLRHVFHLSHNNCIQHAILTYTSLLPPLHPLPTIHLPPPPRPSTYPPPFHSLHLFSISFPCLPLSPLPKSNTVECVCQFVTPSEGGADPVLITASPL